MRVKRAGAPGGCMYACRGGKGWGGLHGLVGCRVHGLVMSTHASWWLAAGHPVRSCLGWNLPSVSVR